MAIKKYKPTSAGVRGMSVLSFDEITKTTPEKSLTVSLNKSGGRNSYGRVTTRHRGGGAKRKYRIIDFKRNKDGIKAVVKSIEYDQTEQQTSLCYNTKMVKRDTSSNHKV